MASDFDPYYTWLGIPPEDQPADFYQLLGVKRFESNAEVISNISDQRMGHVRTFQAGKRAAESQKLLNELATATRTLLDAELKKKYDTELKAKLVAEGKITLKAQSARPAVARPVTAKPAAAAASVPVDASPAQTPGPAAATGQNIIVPSLRDKSSQGLSPVVILGIAGGVTLALGIGVVAAVMSISSRTPEIVQTTPAADVTKEGKEETKTPETKNDPPAEPGPKKTDPPAEAPPSEVPPTAVKPGKHWVFEKSPEGYAGVIRELTPGLWGEYRADGKMQYFTERSRDESSVTIYDSTRKLAFRLGSADMLMRREGGTRWGKVMSGNWSEKEPPLAGLPKIGDGVASFIGMNWVGMRRAGLAEPRQGKWLVTSEKTGGNENSFGILEFPFQPASDYVVEVVVRRTAGKRTFKLICPHSERAVQVVFDALRSGDRFYSGINYFRGKQIYESDDPATLRREEPLFKPDQEAHLCLVVRKDAVTAWIDGKPVLDWQGEMSQIGNDATYATLVDPRKLSLCVTDSAFEISRFEVRPLLPRSTAVPSASPPAATVPGRVAVSYILPGNGSWVEWRSPGEVLPGQPFTCEFWYRNYGNTLETPGLLSAGDLQLLVTPGEKDAQERRYTLLAGDVTVSGPDFAFDNEWHHVALVGEQETITLSIDGKPNFNAPWSRLPVRSLQPLQWGLCKPTPTQEKCLTGVIRSIRIAPEVTYATGQTFTPPVSTAGTSIPTGLSMLQGKTARIMPGHTEYSFQEFAGLAGRAGTMASNVTPPGGIVKTDPAGTSPTPTTPGSENVPGEEKMRPKQDLIFTFQPEQKSKLGIEFPEGTFASDKQVTIEFWWRKPPEAYGYFPLLKAGDISFNFRQDTASSNIRTYVQGPSAAASSSNGPNSREWQHFVFQYNRGMLEFFVNGVRGNALQAPNVGGTGPQRRIEIGSGQRGAGAAASELQLAGEIRSLQVSTTLKYNNASMPPLAYDNVEHGVLVPVKVNLIAENLETKKPDGSSAPRSSMADLLDPNAGNRVAVTKSPPPDKEKLEPAKGTVATVFGSQIKAAVKPELRLELCKELLQASIKETDSIMAFALLGEARTQAVGSGDVGLLLDVIDEVDRRFIIDRLAFQQRLLTDMNATKLAAEEREVLGIEAMQTALQALRADRVPAAYALSEMAYNCLKVGSSDVRKALSLNRDQISAAKKLYDQLEKAQETLKSSPDDPAANLVLGRYYALALENFEKGLPHLEKAAESPLVLAARREVASKTPEDRMAAAEAWTQAAPSLKTHEKVAVQRHAFGMYEVLGQQTTGIMQTKAKERSKELKTALDEVDKVARGGENAKRKSQPRPGLICRIAVGGDAVYNRVLTPYLSVVRSRQDITNLMVYRYTQNYPSSVYSFDLVGYVKVDKEMDVVITLDNCACEIAGRPIDATTTPVANFRTSLKKGNYEIRIRSTRYEYPFFQVNRADTGESLLHYTDELLTAQQNIQLPLPNGNPSPGIRIDQLNGNNNN